MDWSDNGGPLADFSDGEIENGRAGWKFAMRSAYKIWSHKVIWMDHCNDDMTWYDGICWYDGSL